MTRRPKLIRLPQPAGDAQMAEHLLWLLGLVRSGKVKGYSVCLLIESPDGKVTLAEHAAADDPDYEATLLGAMSIAHDGLLQRRRQREEED